jgi:hypothetical protein
MTKHLRLVSVASAFLLALPLAATAAPVREQPRQVTQGYVIWASPVSFAVDTGSAFKTFLIPPGAEFTDQLFPGEKVKVGWVYAERTPEAARPAHEQSVTGHVAFITPDDLALETAQDIDLFALTPHSTLPARVAEGDYVQVFYRVEPETGHKIVNRVATQPAHVATACVAPRQGTARSARMQRQRAVNGEIEWVTPDRLVLATNHGLEDFTVLHPSRVRDLGTGDFVRVTYRVEGAHGPRVAMACSQEMMVGSSAS